MEVVSIGLWTQLNLHTYNSSLTGFLNKCYRGRDCRENQHTPPQTQVTLAFLRPEVVDFAQRHCFLAGAGFEMRGNMYRLTFDADEDVVGGDEDEDEVEMLPGDMWEYWGLAIPKNPKDRSF